MRVGGTLRKPGSGKQGEGVLHRNVQRFRGGLVFKAHRILYHSTLGLRVIKKKKKKVTEPGGVALRMLTYLTRLSLECGTHKTVTSRIWPSL